MSTLLLTGATGSFGTAFVERALEDGWYDRIIAFSDTESNQSAMKRRFPPSPLLEYFIGNVRDRRRVRSAMKAGVDIVIHAAAIKEVPTCEYDWSEAVATNVEGSRNVAQAAVDCGVAKALLVSTDKACEPVTSYGKTKAMAEEWFIRANRGYVSTDSFFDNAHAGQPLRRKGHGTAFGVVRYGNVLASRASVLPAWREKRLLGEALPLTDLRMTRFWWTLTQAVAFVYDVLAQMGPGQIWVPKLRAAPMLTVAQALDDGVVPTSDFRLTGIRGVEKLHEALIGEEEARQTWEVADAYVVMPANPSWPAEPPAGARRASTIRGYRSDDDRRWLTVAEMRALIGAAN